MDTKRLLMRCEKCSSFQHTDSLFKNELCPCFQSSCRHRSLSPTRESLFCRIPGCFHVSFGSSYHCLCRLWLPSPWSSGEFRRTQKKNVMLANHWGDEVLQCFLWWLWCYIGLCCTTNVFKKNTQLGKSFEAVHDLLQTTYCFYFRNIWWCLSSARLTSKVLSMVNHSLWFESCSIPTTWDCHFFARQNKSPLASSWGKRHLLMFMSNTRSFQTCKPFVHVHSIFPNPVIQQKYQTAPADEHSSVLKQPGRTQEQTLPCVKALGNPKCHKIVCKHTHLSGQNWIEEPHLAIHRQDSLLVIANVLILSFTGDACSVGDCQILFCFKENI